MYMHICIKKYSHEFYKYIEYYIDICSVNFNGSFIKLSMWKENKKWIFFTSSTKKSRAQEAQEAQEGKEAQKHRKLITNDLTKSSNTWSSICDEFIMFLGFFAFEGFFALLDFLGFLGSTLLCWTSKTKKHFSFPLQMLSFTKELFKTIELT